MMQLSPHETRHLLHLVRKLRGIAYSVGMPWDDAYRQYVVDTITEVARLLELLCVSPVTTSVTMHHTAPTTQERT